MPRLYSMTYEPKEARWKKIYKGKSYRISCKELGTADTQQASYRAANEWWLVKRKELDSTPRPAPGKKHWDIQEEMEFRRDWLKARGRDQEAATWQARINDLAVHPLGDDPDPYRVLLPPDFDRRVRAIEAYGGRVPEHIDSLSADFQFGDGRLWHGRREEERRAEPAPEDRSVGVQADKYLAYQLARHRAEQISVSDYDQTRQYLAAFRGWLGDATPIEVIDASKWEEWYVLHLNCGKSLDTRKKRFRRARDFVQWLAEKGLITPPSNLLARRYRFKAEEKAIRTLSRDEVRAMIEAAPGQLKLHLLLMINCGFLQQDVADLAQGEVDWERGIITRRRSKTGDHAHVPTVSYRLWPLTSELLKRFRSNHPTLALTTQSGLPWVRDSIDERGIRRRVDAIKSNYAHIAKRHKFQPMSLLRKTAASKLEESPEFGRYAQHFLGHAPASIAAKHYVKPSQEQFERAVTWLGEAFGF